MGHVMFGIIIPIIVQPDFLPQQWWFYGSSSRGKYVKKKGRFPYSAVSVSTKPYITDGCPGSLFLIVRVAVSLSCGLPGYPFAVLCRGTFFPRNRVPP